MTMGQKRNNRETRKPKKGKFEIKAAAAFGSKVKKVETASLQRKAERLA